MLRQIRLSVLAASAAGLLSLCFPSTAFSCLAFIALAPLIIIVEKDALKLAFLRGYLAGLLFFVLTLFWIHHVTLVGLLLLAAYLALYWGAFALGASFSASWPLWRRMVFLPALWTALEYARATLFTGFGWSALAHTQSSNILFIQIADITGTYGISFAIVMVNVVAAAFFRQVIRREKIMPPMFRAFLAVACLVAAVCAYGSWRLADVPQTFGGRIALIQANVTLADYWDPRLKPYVVEEHLRLSREALKQGPELILWPETAFPQFIWDHPDLFEKVRDFARVDRVKVLLGAVTREDEKYFNSALLIDAEGNIAGTYSKQHLVVLGEYIPFRKELPFLSRFVPIDDFTPGTGSSLMPLGSGPFFAPLICFEDTLPELARRAVTGGAGLLVNLTNDAWFGASRQARMHLDNAVFRAIENHVPLVRATNTGMSCQVSPTGEVSGCVVDGKGRSLMVRGYAVVDVPKAPGGRTFYTKYGDVLAMLCFPVILGMLLIRPRRTEA